MNDIPPKPRLDFRELPPFPAIERLKERDQWLTWEYQLKRGADGQMKWTKPPLDAKSGRKGSSTGSTTWASYATAAAFARKRGETGVGYALAPDDGLTGIDLDHCRDAQSGELEPWAAEVVALAETYCEVSPSGTGVRMFADGKVAGATSYVPAGVEIYPGGRYLTLTGQHIPGTPVDIGPAPKTIATLVERVTLMRPKAEGSKKPAVNGTASSRREEGSSFFRDVNRAALDELGAWFPELFPTAQFQPGTGAYRVSSHDLGRNLEEDLSASPKGIVDFGVGDIGDSRLGKRSAIDIVVEQGGGVDLVHAAHWLCDRLGRQPEEFGWKAGRKFTGSAQPRVQTASGEVLPAGGPLTHDGVALHFAQLAEGRMRYCHSTGAWYVWDGFYWRRDETDEALQLARDIARELSAPTTNTDIKEARKLGFANGVERFARGDQRLAVTHKAWDQDPMLLGTPSGTVDLKTGMLREPDPADGITKITAVAPAETADCPLWTAFLRQATNGDEALARFMKQWTGYCLTGLTIEHALVFLYGGGGNGKSVFLNIIAYILSDYAVTAAMDTFTASQNDRHSTELAMLRGARMVSASETEEGRAWAEARIKALTGSDAITARFMRQDNFTFLPAFKLLIIGNHQPVLRNIDDALKRRVNIVPFVHKPAAVDKELETKLKKEAPAILRWIIDGALDWRANGLVRPEVVTETTDAYFSDQDVFRQWFDDQCHFEEANCYISEQSTKLYESWAAYAREAGDDPGTARSFKPRLERIGPRWKKTRAGRFFDFVELKSTRAQRETSQR